MNIDHKIVIAGIICLTVIYLALLFKGQDSEIVCYLIITIIAFAIGIVVPGPRVDNKRGVLTW